MSDQSQVLGKVGKFELIELLGEGGMGQVFIAKDGVLGRLVALKRVRPDRDIGDETRRRFFREARALATIKSRNVISIYEVGEDEDSPYIAAEYLEGQTLAAYLGSKRPLPVEEVVTLAVDFAQGLADSHRAGIIHRDIKPANLFVELPSRTGKLLDFGITLFHPSVDDGQSVKSKGRSFVGTPDYMPLEQLTSSGVDDRADIFSLGVVLYEMCTGGMPFPPYRTLPERKDCLERTIPSPVRHRRGDVPEALSELVSRMLSVRREDRPQTVDEVRQALIAMDKAVASSEKDRAVPPLGQTVPLPTASDSSTVGPESWNDILSDDALLHRSILDDRLKDFLKSCDRKRVARWKLACSARVAQAFHLMAYAHVFGVAMEQDFAKALSLFTEVAAHFHPAYFGLGIMHGNGYGVERDDEAAVRFFLKAANRGYAPAQYTLVTRYRHGQGVKRDERQAFDWCRRAAEQGHLKACLLLGEMHEYGVGTERDRGKAAEWYQKADRGGDADAKYHLDRLSEG